MKTKLHLIAFAVIGAIASIGATNVNAASTKDTAAKTTAAAYNQTDQGLAQFSSTESTTLGIIGDKEGIGATHWTHAGTIGATQSGTDVTIAGVMTNKDGLVTKTTNGNTAKDATTTGTIEAGALHNDATLVFVGTGQGVEIHRSGACRKIHP